MKIVCKFCTVAIKKDRNGTVEPESRPVIKKDKGERFMSIRLTQNINEATHITHGGIFHADEVFATAILATLGDVTVMRVFTVPADTRAFVYDIGRGKYDHHQKGGNGARENGIPSAS